MVLRTAKLIWLLCCTLTVLFTSLAGAQASSCLSSAAAVKSAYPGTRPHWTFRAHDREGGKCWHPGTHAAAHKHQFRTVHHRNPAAASPKPVVVSVDSPPNWSPPTTASETSGSGWSLRVPVPVEGTPAPGQNSFAERFSPVFEVIFFEHPSVVRRIESLISNIQ
jgi:hypothetical protein